VTEKYGVTINSKKFGIRNRLLNITDAIEGNNVYNTTDINDAELRAKDQLTTFQDLTMVTSVVELNEDGSFGSPIKKYKLNESLEPVELC